MNRRDAGPAYLLLFLPYGIAVALNPWPNLSFVAAWLGSFAILGISLSGIIKPLPADRSIMGQVMRPIVLTQIVFVSYTALTSIFNFVDAHGFYYLSQREFVFVNDHFLALLAEGQRLYVLAHGSLVAGMLLGMNYRGSGTWRLRADIGVPRFLAATAVMAVVSANIASRIGVRFNIVSRVESFGLVASVLALTVALRTRERGFLAVAAMIYLANVFTALMSGWKEEVTIVVVLLALFAYPLYKRTVLILAPLALSVLLFVLPAYMNAFRRLNWYGGVDQVTAAKAAAAAIDNGEVDLRRETWDFLANRASEIGMFTRYIDHTPTDHDFYGTPMLVQTAYGLVPRVLWKSKPNLEVMAMQRAYQNGVVSRGMGEVSAKPQFVVDAYLFAGTLGVFAACLIYGLLAALASRAAEYLFGGYLLGSGLMYTALFMAMWRGNAFEFIANDIMWGFLLMGIAFLFAQRAGWLVRAPRPPRRLTPNGGPAVITGMAATPL
jgi:hypothetical protein